LAGLVGCAPDIASGVLLDRELIRSARDLVKSLKIKALPKEAATLPEFSAGLATRLRKEIQENPCHFHSVIVN
jgi:hypothetical protein